MSIRGKQEPSYGFLVFGMVWVVWSLFFVQGGFAQSPYAQGVTLTSSQPTLLEGFGFAVASDGDVVLVGAPHASGTRGQTGKAFLFDRETGKILHVFLPSSPVGDDLFGLSVGLIEQFVVIGAPRGRGLTQRPAGRVEIFDRQSGKFVQEFVSPNSTAAVFGHAMAIQGPWIAIGDPGASSPENFEVGEVLVFELATGKLLHTFLAPEVQQGKADGFGHALAFVGASLAISAPMGGVDPIDHGKIYLFDLQSHELVGTLKSLEPQSNEYFGWSLVSDGEALLVGALGRGAEAGAVYYYNHSGEFQKRLESPHPQSGDHFGEAVALLKNHYVVAAPGDDSAGVDSGTVFVFDKQQGSLQFTLSNPGDATGVADLFGLSMNGSKEHLFVGAPYGDLANMPDAGLVYQFSFPSLPPLY
ncbi:hypothetical protein [Candidatus Nitronereus thalassa]|uniref:Uncharacterized protein n=1 Tax=Candidatus Nitronereus thalassa TaxID=3020898 RepID=A0ABU3K5E9_9BACT|nr:hypothetical protein [Candidatus Nitronereus thalassa]MDT7041585.1 hypothetical protein [Candidatus Nitronereus thalassa]